MDIVNEQGTPGVECASLVLNDELGLPRVCLYWESRRQKMMAVGGKQTESKFLNFNLPCWARQK
jgi:hypothetical protein